MTAPGFVRTNTEARLVTLLAALDGYQADPDDDTKWWVTQPVYGDLKNRRVVVIGTPEGDTAPDGVRSGAGPSIDAWTIHCGIVATNYDDPATGKAAVEAVLNDIADLLADNHRLTLAGEPAVGCRDLMIEAWEGPYFGWESGQAPVAWINFDLSAQADIRRNPS